MPADQPLEIAGKSASTAEVGSPAGTVTARLLKLWLLWALVAYGVVLRLVNYLHNPSLWRDEATLALNIVELPIGYFISTPLQLFQNAPPGFMVSVKAITWVFGTGEYALRFVPLMTGVLSVFLFVKLAQRLLPFNAVLIATALFALNTQLVFYSTQFKHYSLDVAAALVLFLLVVHYWDKPLNHQRVIALAASGAVAIWFSYPTVFVLAVCGSLLALRAFTRRDWTSAIQLAFVGAVWVSSFFLLYTVLLRDYANSWLYDYWQYAYPNLLPQSLRQFERTVDLFVSETIFTMSLNPEGIAIIAIVLGAVSVFARSRWVLGLLLLPIVLLFVAAGLEQYAYSMRLILFVAVPLTLLAGEGVHTLLKLVHRPVFTYAVIALVFFSPIISHLTDDHAGNRLEMRPMVARLSELVQADDVILVAPMSLSPFLYYSRNLDWEARGVEVVHLGTRRIDDVTLFTDQISLIAEEHPDARLWTVINSPTDNNELRFILYQLDRHGLQLDVVRTLGIVTYLHVLTPTDAPVEWRPFERVGG